MQTMETIRKWHFESIERSLAIVGSLLQIIPAEGLKTYRDGGTGWTFLEVLCHLRDFEHVFLERAELTMMQEFPPLPFPSPDEMAKERDYNSQDPQAVYDEWVNNRQQYLKFMRNIKEEDWERPGNHPKRGRFTLNDQLMVTAWHDTNHLEQMTRILAEKR